jgi:hypothetical protein
MKIPEWLFKRYTAITQYFMGWYGIFPDDIQQKARNLLFLLLGGIGVFTAIFIYAITLLDVFELIASAFAVVVCGIALNRLKDVHPVTAGNIAILVFFYTFLDFGLRDVFSPSFQQISRINDTAIELVLGIIFASTYVILRRQFILLALCTYLIIISHYIILIHFDLGGVVGNDDLTTFIVTTIILSVTIVASLRIFTLITGQRGKVFTNILFYKFGRAGPSLMYSEKSLQGEAENAAGAYFYTALGQGMQYSTGLFGPIPFGEKMSHQVAFVYANIITDSTAADERLKGTNYFMIALVTVPENVSHINRKRLEEGMEEVVQSIHDLSDLTDKQFEYMANHIRLI